METSKIGQRSDKRFRTAQGIHVNLLFKFLPQRISDVLGEVFDVLKGLGRKFRDVQTNLLQTPLQTNATYPGARPGLDCRPRPEFPRTTVRRWRSTMFLRLSGAWK